MTAITHYQVTAELVTDDKGPFISLAQQDDCMNDPSTVYLHPWQLRAILERFGVIAADKGAEKVIATLERRLRVLRDRISSLHGYMARYSDHKHADLSYEMALLSATLDIADEFCHGLDTPTPGAPLNVVHPTPAPHAAPECSPAPADDESKPASIVF